MPINTFINTIDIASFTTNIVKKQPNLELLIG